MSQNLDAGVPSPDGAAKVSREDAIRIDQEDEAASFSCTIQIRCGPVVQPREHAEIWCSSAVDSHASPARTSSSHASVVLTVLNGERRAPANAGL